MAKTNKTNKTFKVIEAIEPDELERIKVSTTKVVDLSNISTSDESIDEELAKLSKRELEYRLKFEETDPIVIAKIKKLLKSK
jgi:hypothetical protein